VQIGSGTYSNVYKAIEVESGAVVALKKVRVDGVGEEESARFMAREIALLRHLGAHDNVVSLHGLVTSRLATAPSLYLVFEYMDHDLTGLAAAAAASGARFTLPQVCMVAVLATRRCTIAPLHVVHLHHRHTDIFLKTLIHEVQLNHSDIWS
jgi:serine/threonine protein kinase